MVFMLAMPGMPPYSSGAPAGEEAGQLDDVGKPGLVITPRHDVFGRGPQAGVEHIDVIGRFRDIGGDAEPQVEVDVVEPVHQAPEVVYILKSGGPSLPAIEIENLDGRPPGAQVDLVIREIQIVDPVASVQDHTTGGLGRLVGDQLAREGDARLGTIYFGTS
jgi:hypothetical protein